MAGAWFIHWPVRPVRGLYGPKGGCAKSVEQLTVDTQGFNVAVYIPTRSQNFLVMVAVGQTIKLIFFALWFLYFFLSSFFLAYQRSEIGCLPYFHTMVWP